MGLLLCSEVQVPQISVTATAFPIWEYRGYIPIIFFQINVEVHIFKLKWSHFQCFFAAPHAGTAVMCKKSLEGLEAWSYFVVFERQISHFKHRQTATVKHDRRSSEGTEDFRCRGQLEPKW